MISGIDSGAIASSGNINVLKKAMTNEEMLMRSLLDGMEGTQKYLQNMQAPVLQETPKSTQKQGLSLDIMA